jgi:hypothetical protein
MQPPRPFTHAGAVVGMLLAISLAHAQSDYPNKPVKIVI